MQPSDDEQWERVRRGDPLATRAFVERWSTPLYRFASRYTANAEDARDLSQETLLRALRHQQGFDPSFRVSTWLFRICRNACIDLRRRRRPTVEVDEEHLAADDAGPDGSVGPSPFQAIAALQDARRVRQALEQVRESYREILVLYHFEELSYREIADLLDIPMGTVMNRLFRARAMLRDVLVADGAGP